MTIRPLAPGDEDAYDWLRSRALFGQASPEQRALAWAVRPPEQILGAFTDGRLIGAAATYPFEISVPGGSVGTVGVAGVSVLPTHTRRGTLRRLMAEIFEQASEAGQPMSCLWASEAPIYGRFGFAVGTRSLHWTVERRAAAFAGPARALGDVTLLGTPDPERLAPVYAGLAARVPGVIARTPAWWDRRLHDPDGSLTAAVTDGGYALYRVGGGWSDGGPDYALNAVEVVATDDRAYATLWRYLLDVDLVATVSAGMRPIDDAIQWMLADGRALRRRLGEGMWVRVLDVPAALQARTYSAPAHAVLDVVDPLVASNQGRWRLDVGDDGKATVEAAGGADADATMGVDALGATVLGGTRFADLVRAGLVTEATPGTAARLDLAFLASPAPWAVTWF